MPLMRGPGPLDCIRHVWSKPAALGRDVTEPQGSGYGGSGISFGWHQGVKGKWSWRRINGLHFAGKKVTLTHCNGLQWHPRTLNQLIESKLSQIGVLLCMCSHDSLSHIGFFGGSFGHGQMKHSQVLLWLVPASSTGCRHCQQHGHQLGWRGSWC